MSLRLLAAGTNSLVVDAGRSRSRGLGVPVGGPADVVSLALGNALVGNPPDTPALEFTLSGPTLVADTDVGMCVFGFQLAEWAEWQGRIAGVVGTVVGVAGAVIGLQIALRADRRAIQ